MYEAFFIPVGTEKPAGQICGTSAHELRRQIIKQGKDYCRPEMGFFYTVWLIDGINIYTGKKSEPREMFSGYYCRHFAPERATHIRYPRALNSQIYKTLKSHETL